MRNRLMIVISLTDDQLDALTGTEAQQVEVDNSLEVEIPARNEVCSMCDGEGKHSRHIGAITSDEWDMWSCDEKEAYKNGEYDQTCEKCDGKRVVQVPNLKLLSGHKYEKNILSALKDEEEYRRMCRSESYMQSGMMGDFDYNSGY